MGNFENQPNPPGICHPQPPPQPRPQPHLKSLFCSILNHHREISSYNIPPFGDLEVVLVKGGGGLLPGYFDPPPAVAFTAATCSVQAWLTSTTRLAILVSQFLLHGTPYGALCGTLNPRVLLRGTRMLATCTQIPRIELALSLMIRDDKLYRRQGFC